MDYESNAVYKAVIDKLCDLTGMQGSQWGPKIITPYVQNVDEASILLAMPGTMEELYEKLPDLDNDYIKERVDWFDLVGICVPRKRDKGTVYFYHADPIAIKDTMSYNWMYDKYEKTPEMERFMYYWDVWDSTDQVEDVWVDKDKQFREAQASGKREFDDNQIRVIPLPGTVKDGTELDPIEDYNYLVTNAPGRVVNECCCNYIRYHETGQAGHDVMSQNPDTGEPDNNVCLHITPFGDMDYCRERGLGTELTVEEAIEHGKRMAKRGLVMTANGGYPVVGQVCCCDSRGCAICRPVWEHNMHSFWESRFRADVDYENCIGCGNCLKRCPFGVITLVKDMDAFDQGIMKAKAVVDADKCVGCGACVMGCPKDAIGLICVRDKSWLVTAPTACAIDDPELSGVSGYFGDAVEK